MFANWQNKCYLEIISGQAFLSSDQLHPRVRDGQVLKVHLEFKLEKIQNLFSNLLVVAGNRVDPTEVG